MKCLDQLRFLGFRIEILDRPWLNFNFYSLSIHYFCYLLVYPKFLFTKYFLYKTDFLKKIFPINVLFQAGTEDGCVVLFDVEDGSLQYLRGFGKQEGLFFFSKFQLLSKCLDKQLYISCSKVKTRWTFVNQLQLTRINSWVLLSNFCFISV